jgi:drug/metabolite transporter (DMT)-like permease
MPISRLNTQRLLFAFLCIVWGTNWLAMKVGVMTVPPGLFSGLRWTVAGLVLVGWRWWHGMPVLVRRVLMPRVVVLSIILIPVNTFIMLYGLRHVSSGLASVLSSGLTPLGLLLFAVMLGQERFSRQQGYAIALGLAGMALLYGPKIAAGQLGMLELLGSLGIIIGNLAYCLGSVLSRPLMRMVSPALIAALTNLIGGTILLATSLAFEPGVAPFLTGHWGLAAWLSWLFQVVAGSLGATVIYFFLVRDWGASKTGTYAFVSPVIAVAAGMLVLGETVEPVEAAGMLLMLGAAAVALRH